VNKTVEHNGNIRNPEYKIDCKVPWCKLFIKL